MPPEDLGPQRGLWWRRWHTGHWFLELVLETVDIFPWVPEAERLHRPLVGTPWMFLLMKTQQLNQLPMLVIDNSTAVRKGWKAVTLRRRS